MVLSPQRALINSELVRMKMLLRSSTKLIKNARLTFNQIFQHNSSDDACNGIWGYIAYSRHGCRFQDVATKADADDNIIVHMDLVNHFWEPFFRTTSLSLLVPMTRSRRKVDRDFSSINVENSYNTYIYTCVRLGTGRIIETNLPGFDYSHNKWFDGLSACCLQHRARY